MNRSMRIALLTLLAVGLSGPVLADSISISNFSFEDSPRVDGVFTPQCVIPGWVIPGCFQTGYWNPSVAQSSAAFVAGIPDGDHISFSNSSDIFQTTGETIQGGVSYILTVGVGGRPSLLTNHEIQLLADDGMGGFTPLASSAGQDVLNQWCDQSVCYAVPFGSTAVGQTLRVGLANPLGVAQVNYDDVRLERVDGIACGQVTSTCPQAAQMGACCTNGPGTDSDCITTTQTECVHGDGHYLGDNSQCIGSSECTLLVVTYESFTADATEDGVMITWVTAAEVDTVGFRLLRAVAGDREKSLSAITGIIPAAGNSLEGATYQHLDRDRHLLDDVIYFIEDLDIYGKVTRHGPITVNRGSGREAGRTRATRQR